MYVLALVEDIQWKGVESEFARRSRELCTSTSTLVQEAVLREWLAIVIAPCSKIRICVCFDIPVYICMCGEVFGITTYILLVGFLVHSHVIDPHSCGEREVSKVDFPSEVERHAQVRDNVHRLLRDRTRPNFNPRIRCHASLFERPCQFTIRSPRDVCAIEARNVFEAIHREAPLHTFVTSLVYLGNNRRCLLVGGSRVRIVLGY